MRANFVQSLFQLPLRGTAPARMTSHDHPPHTKKRLIVLGAALVAFAALAAAWRFGPLADWLDAGALERAAEWVEAQPFTPLWVLGAYVVGALCALPLTVMILITATLFEPLPAFGYMIGGALAGGAAGFALGQLLGSATIQRLAGSRLHELSRRLGQRGFLAVAFIRLLPVAPFTVANMVAGASHIRWRDFLLGTLVGTIPGALAATMFIDRLLAAVRDPSPGAIALLVVVVGVIALGVVALRRWVARLQA
ncbi:MAG TPA: VTT domain-containing protein [Burkholderiaceae bacterium]|nr:VTT domain-containing protein [Burkholderiaceae bacterium]